MRTRAPPYEYNALAGPRNIRILILQPARDFSHPIKCVFDEVTLTDTLSKKQQYEALSYTWGSPTGTQPILCDDATVLVTPNCEHAILYLRRKFTPRRLWIDAICINQASIQEKNQQVPMMGDIYSYAACSIMWLGLEGDPRLSGVLRRAARYGDAANVLGGVMRKAKNNLKRVGGYGESYADNTIDSTWQANVIFAQQSEDIATLVKNEWFRRIWTIQEFLLSTSGTFLMGRIECPAAALYTYYRMGEGLVNRADVEHYRMRNSLLTLTPLTAEGLQSTVFVNVILWLAALNHATNPRDKVYGMLAFLETKWPDCQLPTVDYAKSVSEVYESFVRCLITLTDSLCPLELVTGPSVDTEFEDLPSWVMDLRSPDKLVHPSRDYSSRKLPKLILPPYKPGQLIVRAKRIGRVAHTSSKMPYWESSEMRNASTKEMEDARTACLSEWTAFVTHLDLQKDPSESPYRYHKSEGERLGFYSWADDRPLRSDPNFCALTAFTSALNYLRWKHEPEDDISIDSRTTPDRKRWMLEKRKQQRESQPEDSSPHDARHRPHDMQTLFVTTRGYLAVCPGNVQPRDSIYMIEGSAYQFVLRRKNKDYVVVGRVEIYEIRDGSKTKWDSSKLESDPDAKHIVLV